MGNDGGSIPKRRELVKDAARPLTLSELKATALESLTHAWTHCALSNVPIDLDAVVSDHRGRLYNYESILKALMPSDEPPPEPTPASLGIKSLRDVAKLKFAKNASKYTCPISMKELGPATKCVYIIPCAHVFAEAAIAEIQVEFCPECGEPFTQDNIVPILPTTKSEFQRLQKRIDDLRAASLTHTLKKDKSEKKKKRKGDEMKENNEDREKRHNGAKKEDSRISGINNSLAASLTAKVLAEQDERNKRRKIVADAAKS